MKIWKFTFGGSLPSVRVAGVLVSAVLALLFVSPAVAAEMVLHVSPTGDDAGDGSRAKPVASLMGARDAVRRLRAAGRTGPVRVVVADGTYLVTEPLVLKPEDGGSAEAAVRYEAASGAKPLLSGGRAITGFRAGENGLWVAEVPGVAAGQWYFEQLWAGGCKRTVLCGWLTAPYSPKSQRAPSAHWRLPPTMGYRPHDSARFTLES